MNQGQNYYSGQPPRTNPRYNNDHNFNQGGRNNFKRNQRPNQRFDDDANNIRSQPEAVPPPTNIRGWIKFPAEF